MFSLLPFSLFFHLLLLFLLSSFTVLQLVHESLPVQAVWIKARFWNSLMLPSLWWGCLAREQCWAHACVLCLHSDPRSPCAERPCVLTGQSAHLSLCTHNDHTPPPHRHRALVPEGLLEYGSYCFLDLRKYWMLVARLKLLQNFKKEWKTPHNSTNSQEVISVNCFKEIPVHEFILWLGTLCSWRAQDWEGGDLVHFFSLKLCEACSKCAFERQVG